MQAFCTLFDQLDRAAGTGERVEALADYFARVPAADAAWALRCLLGRQRRRLISGRRLRQICLQGSDLPEWLFAECHGQVGDSAETIALLWGSADAPGRRDGEAAAGTPPDPGPLHRWMERILPELAALQPEAQAEAVQRVWNTLHPRQLLVLNKLLTGGFRLGVGQGLVVRALARLSGLEESLLHHRLMGGFDPSAAAFESLLARGDQPESAARPYPFFLASPLDPARLERMDVADWLAEWKWDGIRGQLLHRPGAALLWSRGEELLNDGFPELIELAAALPPGTVLDGEILVWPQGRQKPLPFAVLQRRLGRRAPAKALLRECPAAFVAYDLLEAEGGDLRDDPLEERRRRLNDLVERLRRGAAAEPAARLRPSPALPLADWASLNPLRQEARSVGAEGLMLKARRSPYLVGRRRGHWWKHKLEPLRLDAVLLYAQAGSGRRANLFTDYTFALWSEPPGPAATPAGSDAPRLVTFAKAYSGLDDGEIQALDRWIRSHTLERFGPVRAVEPVQVFELAFEGLQRSSRHRSGLAVRFPRIRRWRRDKPAAE
ncbi:MAG: ATP-dependent DNA ligase, partial [Synechococcaceae cyanobacterium]|nr:ATP-dependent DNA ligase [Synechococcaceae cyanobacterium]